MLPNDISPLHRLILPWWKAETRPDSSKSHPMREALFAAALQEILDHHATGTSTDPTQDPRFRWAIQHLEVIEGSRKIIDTDIRVTASVYLDPTPFLSRSFAAANDAG